MSYQADVNDVPAPITVVDTPAINLTAGGTLNHTVHADVVIGDPTTDLVNPFENRLVLDPGPPTGLYANRENLSVPPSGNGAGLNDTRAGDPGVGPLRDVAIGIHQHRQIPIRAGEATWPYVSGTLTPAASDWALTNVISGATQTNLSSYSAKTDEFYYICGDVMFIQPSAVGGYCELTIPARAGFDIAAFWGVCGECAFGIPSNKSKVDKQMFIRPGNKLRFLATHTYMTLMVYVVYTLQ